MTTNITRPYLTIRCRAVLLIKMADHSGIQLPVPTANTQPVTQPQENNEEIDCFGRPGSQIDDKIEFKNQFGESVYAVPVIIDFKRVMQLGQVSPSEGVIAGVSETNLHPDLEPNL